MSAPHPFTLRQLQYVLAVADTLSFSKAAERCRVSQPSLSAQLAQLESMLGVRLFERDQRHVVLTGPGRELVARARSVIASADELLDAARRACDPLAGTLRIGVIPTVSPYLLPAIAPALRQEYPRLTVRWVEDKTAALVRALDEGALDAALLALEADIGDVEHAVIARDPFVLAVPLSHPLANRSTPARSDELRAADVLLLDDGHCFRDQVLAFCAHAEAAELEFRATSLSTLVQMVAGGSGVTVLPSVAVAIEAARAQLRVRAFAAPEPGRTLALAWRKRSPLGGALKQVALTMKTAYPVPADRAGGAS